MPCLWISETDSQYTSMNVNSVYKRECWQSPGDMDLPPDTFPKQHIQSNPLNAVRKTMSTMETLGIRLPPPGFHPQETTTTTNAAGMTATYQQPWRHEPVSHVQMTVPGAASQSYEQSYGAFSPSYVQFQPESEHFEECGLSYTPSPSGRDDELLENIDALVEADSSMATYQCSFPCQDENQQILPGVMRVPLLDPEQLYQFYNIPQDAQHSIASLGPMMEPAMTAEEINMPGLPVTSFCDPQYPGVVEDFMVPNSAPSSLSPDLPYMQRPPYDINKELRQFQESRAHQTNKRLAARSPNDARTSWTTGQHASKPTKKPSTLSNKAPNRVQKPTPQPHSHNRHAILPLQNSNEILTNLMNPPILPRDSKPPQQYYQQQQQPQQQQQQQHIHHQLAPPILLPSNADSSGIPMKTSYSSIRRPNQRLLGSSSHIDDDPRATPSRRLYASLSLPPDLLAPLMEEPDSPPDTDMTPEDPELTPHKQKLRFDNDLYTPLWVRGHGNKREGWCGICKPGRWLVLKNSAFWYDKSFSHGVSAVTGRAFEAPKEIRRIKRTKHHDNNSSSSDNHWDHDINVIDNDNGGNTHSHDYALNRYAGNKTTTTWEGLCGSCGDWIPLVSSKKKGTTWFRHAYKCQSQFKSREKDGGKDSNGAASSSSSSSSLNATTVGTSK